MLYGNKRDYDFLIDDLNHKWFNLPIHSPDKKKTELVPIQAQIRIMPFGLVEYVFPKEYLNEVLTGLRFHLPAPYNLDKKILGIKPLSFIQKYLNIKPIPKFDTSKTMIMPNLSYSIIPVGIREDAEITEPEGHFKDWTHEAI